MASTSTHANLIEALMFGLRYVQSTQHWLVIVTPNDGLELCQRFLVGALPLDAKFTGRTARLSEGGAISIVPASEAVFLPPDTRFSVMFVGWGDTMKAESADMLRWKTAAEQVVSKLDND